MLINGTFDLLQVPLPPQTRPVHNKEIPLFRLLRVCTLLVADCLASIPSTYNSLPYLLSRLISVKLSLQENEISHELSLLAISYFFINLIYKNLRRNEIIKELVINESMESFGYSQPLIAAIPH